MILKALRLSRVFYFREVERCGSVRILFFSVVWGSLVRVSIFEDPTARCGAVFFKEKSFGAVRFGKPHRTAPTVKSLGKIGCFRVIPLLYDSTKLRGETKVRIILFIVVLGHAYRAFLRVVNAHPQERCPLRTYPLSFVLHEISRNVWPSNCWAATMNSSTNSLFACSTSLPAPPRAVWIMGPLDITAHAMNQAILIAHSRAIDGLPPGYDKNKRPKR